MRVIRRIELVILFMLIVAAVMIGIRKYDLYSEDTQEKNDSFQRSQEFERYVSSYDTDGDGVDDQTDMLESARAYIETKPKYKSKYYSGGYPDDEYGVCTDVVAQAMLGTGFDLQKLIDEDIKENPQDYDIEKLDSNIDFRRVPNQNVYFKNHAISLTKDLSETEKWQGGDIVVFKKHIGIVSDRRGKDGVPYLIHHYKKGQKKYEENTLKRWGKVVGHYRLN